MYGVPSPHAWLFSCCHVHVLVLLTSTTVIFTVVQFLKTEFFGVYHSNAGPSSGVMLA